MSKRRVITIDNGGSELRYIANSDGHVVKTMDKNVRIIEKEGFRVKTDVEAYDIIDIVRAPQDKYTGMYAMGIGFYMYDGADISMSNQNKKTNTDGWYQQIILAIATDAMKSVHTALEKLSATEDDIEAVVDVDTTFEYILTTLIPVHEHSGTMDYVTKLKENLSGRYEVVFPAVKEGPNRIVFELDKNHIGVLPEGVVCMTALRKDVSNSDYTLVIDMGHITTDISIFKGINIIGKAVVSSPYAGGTLLKLISSVIRDHNCVPSTEMAIEALQTNKFRIGTKEINISEEIKNAKRIFITNYLKNDILSAIELAGITTTSIQYVVPIGAPLGLVNPDNGEHDILQNIIEGVNLENAVVKIVADDLRYVNIMKAAEFGDAFSKKV